MYFSGENTHVLDSKGRISLPAVHRRALPEQVIISKGFDKTLYLFAPEEREAWLSSLIEYDELDPEIRDFYRRLNAGAATVEVDAAGRVNIPANLREYAGLGKEVVILGNQTRLEFWDAARWNEYNNEDIDDLALSVRAKKSE